MDQAPVWIGEWFGLSSLGFYVFLAVWLGMAIWARTKEKLALHETISKLADGGTQVTPEVIDALKRRQPKRSAAETRVRAQKHLYWGACLVALGVLAAVLDWPTVGVALFVIPGIFYLMLSLTTWRARIPVQG
jgi:heme O synthase-like polyprenyltransferase